MWTKRYDQGFRTERPEARNSRLKGRCPPRIQSTVYRLLLLANFIFQNKPANSFKTKEGVRNRTKQTHQVVENTSKYFKSLKMKTKCPKQLSIKHSAPGTLPATGRGEKGPF